MAITFLLPIARPTGEGFALEEKSGVTHLKAWQFVQNSASRVLGYLCRLPEREDSLFLAAVAAGF